MGIVSGGECNTFNQLIPDELAIYSDSNTPLICVCQICRSTDTTTKTTLNVSKPLLMRETVYSAPYRQLPLILIPLSHLIAFSISFPSPFHPFSVTEPFNEPLDRALWSLNASAAEHTAGTASKRRTIPTAIENNELAMDDARCRGEWRPVEVEGDSKREDKMDVDGQ